MADLELEDEKTLEQSNSNESEDQTDDSAKDQQDDSEAGKAAEDVSDEAEGEAKKPDRSERRHERYIDKLSSEIRQSAAQPDTLTDDLFAPRAYDPLKYQEGEEYDPQALEEDRKAAQASKFAEGLNLGYSQANNRNVLETFETRLDVDSERVAQKWDVLDPTKTDVYRPNLEKSLVQEYIAFTGMEKDQKTGRITIAKPNIRFRDFVDARMQDMEDYAAAKAAKSTENVSKQAARTGVRPTGQGRQSSGGHGFDDSSPEAAVQSVANMTSKQYFELGGKEASDAYLAKRGLA